MSEFIVKGMIVPFLDNLLMQYIRESVEIENDQRLKDQYAGAIEFCSYIERLIIDGAFDCEEYDEETDENE